MSFNRGFAEGPIKCAGAGGLWRGGEPNSFDRDFPLMLSDPKKKPSPVRASLGEAKIAGLKVP